MASDFCLRTHRPCHYQIATSQNVVADLNITPIEGAVRIGAAHSLPVSATPEYTGKSREKVEMIVETIRGTIFPE